jgi:bifunctional DNA-binding transcriptional regulator/antitoxin component of YhaV-PrlF toxin-antitoxin module
MVMSTIRLQMKTHTLPKGGRVAQYTASIPKELVKELGWKKGEKIAVEVRGSHSILLKKCKEKKK